MVINTILFSLSLSRTLDYIVHFHQIYLPPSRYHTYYVTQTITGGLWKATMFVPTVEVEPQTQTMKEAGHHHLDNTQMAQPQSDFPLLYHLLLLRNFYQNSGQLDTTESREDFPDPNQPLDLSVKGNEQYFSGFLKEKNKISYDESIKDNEEIEVVAKDEKSKSESVKQFVERKIKEYQKAEENFESFVNKPNLKENDIQRKMEKIKTKYTKINNKLKKLEQLKPKLVNEKINDDEEEIHDSSEERKEEIGSPVENVEEEEPGSEEEPNNNKPSPDDDHHQHQQQQERRLSLSESQQSSRVALEDKLHLKPGHVGDGTRVSVL